MKYFFTPFQKSNTLGRILRYIQQMICPPQVRLNLNAQNLYAIALKSTRFAGTHFKIVLKSSGSVLYIYRVFSLALKKILGNFKCNVNNNIFCKGMNWVWSWKYVIDINNEKDQRWGRTFGNISINRVSIGCEIIYNNTDWTATIVAIRY